jgi:SOS response regulatory protein OraA/RecX
MAPRVTALVEQRGGRVRVELDGTPWRTLPAAAVVRASLLVGTELDRERARELRRALRLAEALDLAGRALARRDRPAASVAELLERRGVAPTARDGAVAALAERGALDDLRFAKARAAALATRGWGDAAIAFDLERQGVHRERIEPALSGLAPEDERAAGIVAAKGATPRTARRLAARGFSEDAVEAAFALVAD